MLFTLAYCMKKSREDKIIASIEKGYDMICEKFSETRSKKFWRDLSFIKNYSSPESKVLDFGCGSGRLLKLLNQNFAVYHGVDISKKLIEVAKKGNETLKNKINFRKISRSFKRLPYKSGYFDTIFSIAVFHHFPGIEYQRKIVRELSRVLKREGLIVVTVWDVKNSKIYRNRSKELLKNQKRFKLLGSKEILMPFKDGRNVFNRYHYCYSKSELQDLFRGSTFITLHLAKIGDNLLYIGKKSNLKKSTDPVGGRQ